MARAGSPSARPAARGGPADWSRPGPRPPGDADRRGHRRRTPRPQPGDGRWRVRLGPPQRPAPGRAGRGLRRRRARRPGARGSGPGEAGGRRGPRHRALAPRRRQLVGAGTDRPPAPGYGGRSPAAGCDPSAARGRAATASGNPAAGQGGTASCARPGQPATASTGPLAPDHQEPSAGHRRAGGWTPGDRGDEAPSAGGAGDRPCDGDGVERAREPAATPGGRARLRPWYEPWSWAMRPGYRSACARGCAGWAWPTSWRSRGSTSGWWPGSCWCSRRAGPGSRGWRSRWPGSALYLLLVGPRPSLLRASVMAGLAAAALLASGLHRRPMPWRSPRPGSAWPIPGSCSRRGSG